jgi:hypothetical protein
MQARQRLGWPVNTAFRFTTPPIWNWQCAWVCRYASKHETLRKVAQAVGLSILPADS